MSEQGGVGVLVSPRTDHPVAGKLRVAVVGAGRMGQWHGRAARRSGAEIVAVVDLDTTRAVRLAADFGVSAVGADLFAMAEAGRLDAVHIATPAASHANLVHQAIAARIHVLVEKPLTETAREAEQLFELARKCGVLLCPVHQLPFQDGALKAAAELPAIDKPVAIDMRIFSAGGVGLSSSAFDWVIGEILPHPLSTLRALWPHAPLAAGEWSVQSPAAGELALAGDHAGALLSVVLSLSARPPRLDMTIAGRQGSIDINFFHGYRVHLRGWGSRLQKIVQPLAVNAAHLTTAGINLAGRTLRRETAYPGLGRLVDCFYAAVRGAAPSPIAAADALAVAAARDTIMARLTEMRRSETRQDGGQGARRDPIS